MAPQTLHDMEIARAGLFRGTSGTTHSSVPAREATVATRRIFVKLQGLSPFFHSDRARPCWNEQRILAAMKGFECPECGAGYAVIELAVPAGAPRDFSCLHCGKPLPVSDGPTLLQYTLLKRPFEPARDDPADPLPQNDANAA